MKPLTIGEIARRAEVGIETIRYYERQGLLLEAGRKSSGYRQFDEGAVRRLRFIRRAKQLGFTLKEIKGLLGLRVDATATRSDVRRQAEAKIEDIIAKIRDLERMKLALQQLMQTCHGDGEAANCPILEALDREDDPTERERSTP